MRQLQDQIQIRTAGRGLVEITSDVARVVERSGVTAGLCVVYCAHTSASLFIQENADPTVQSDLVAWLERLAPDGDPRYRHDTEGPDDMSAHLKCAVTRTSETIPVRNGRMALGTWQGIYLVEHRTRPHSRTVIVHVMGE
jgi:secondary thiamine-phosphate synthase enzyme